MKISRVVGSRLGFLSAALFMLVGIAAPAALTTSVSAAVVTDRSIALSSSSADASGVAYTLTFTPSQSAGATVLEFCNDSPIVGEVCTAPSGFTVASVSADTGTAAVFESHNNVILWTNAITATQTTVEFSAIHNPTATGALYARLLTYTDATTAGTQYTDSETVGTYLDEGGFALSITNPINVSAAVRETMTFCVSAADPTANCGGTSTPSMELGEGTPKALDSSATSTGIIYNQLSTNAVGGATVKMKTNNSCGGLKRAGASVCDIAPVATSTDAIAAGTAKFGLKVTAAGFTVATNYSGSNYGFNYVANNSTGVTSAYGDTVYSSTGPVDDQEATMNFAASINSTTPAGKYQASLNLIATGTF